MVKSNIQLQSLNNSLLNMFVCTFYFMTIEFYIFSELDINIKFLIFLSFNIFIIYNESCWLNYLKNKLHNIFKIIALYIFPFCIEWLIILICKAQNNNNIIISCYMLFSFTIIVDITIICTLRKLKKSIIVSLLFIYGVVIYAGIYGFTLIVSETDYEYQKYGLLFSIFLIFLMFKNDSLSINNSLSLSNSKKYISENINGIVLFIENFMFASVIFLLAIPYVEGTNKIQFGNNKSYTFCQVSIIFSLAIILSIIVYEVSNILILIIRRSIKYNDNRRSYKFQIINNDLNNKLIYGWKIPVFMIILSVIFLPLMVHYAPRNILLRQLKNYNWNINICELSGKNKLYKFNKVGPFIHKNSKSNKNGINNYKIKFNAHNNILQVKSYHPNKIFNKSRYLKFKLKDFTPHNKYVFISKSPHIKMSMSLKEKKTK